MRTAGKQVDRFWVYRFVERDKNNLAVYGAFLMEKERHEVSAHDLERYVEKAAAYLKDIPSLSVWNADEIRIGSLKKQRPPQVIVIKDTPPGTTTMTAVRNAAPLTALPAISKPAKH